MQDENIITDKQWAKQSEKGSTDKAMIILNYIKTELATRPTNEHVGSGLGGNAGELLFLLTHEVVPVISYTDPKKIGWFKKGAVIEVRFAPKEQEKKRDVLALRQQLTDFINKEFSSPSMDFPTLLSLIPALERNTCDVVLLQRAIKQSAHFANELQHTLKLQNAISILSNKEEKDLEIAFCQEFGFQHADFEIETSPLSKMMRKHPVHGPKLEAKEKRFSDMDNLLLSETDILNLKTIVSYPPYITTLCMRTQLGIELIVSLNLDEHMGSFTDPLSVDLDDDL